MQNTTHGTTSTYRERLSPSLPVLTAAALAGPMLGLVLAPVDATIALLAGAVLSAAIIALLVLGAPVIDVRDGTLRAGRAHIGVDLLGAVEIFDGEAAREHRGPQLDPRSWHVIRGGIDGVAVIEVVDPEDPTPSWVVSSRTPDRLAAAVRRARSTPRTPGR